MTAPTSPTESEQFVNWIRAKLQTEGDVTFAHFMEWALYHPQYGYYSRGPNIGPRGDFTTSPEASPAFGELFATHAAEIDALLGSPPIFDLIECGPGRGTLAADLLNTLSKLYPKVYERMRYWLVEISPALGDQQRTRLGAAGHSGCTRWAHRLDELPKGLTGTLIANEVVDAFPVHVLENRSGAVVEHYVAAGESTDLRLTYHEPADARLLGFMTRYGLDLQPGQRIEINLAADDWVQQVAAVLTRGIATIIDYGDEQPARYSEARREGTLLGYFGGAVTDNLLARPGLQDLTALVDFTALEDAAAGAGLDSLLKTRQANFLLGLGLGTAVTADLPGIGLEDALARRRGLQALVNPEGLGKFHVLALGKGITAAQAGSLSAAKFAGI